MKYDQEQHIVSCFKEGKTAGLDESSSLSKHLETSLAHLFFYENNVYKLYKQFDDSEHPITGGLADPEARREFIARDFSLNSFFSRGVYQSKYGLEVHENDVALVESDGPCQYVVFQMERLDEHNNLHEKLLKQDVTKEQLYTIGQFTAKMIAEYPAKNSTETNWYNLAKERTEFLQFFFSNIPDSELSQKKKSEYIQKMFSHVDAHKDEYRQIRGENISISVDNHDENVFWKNNGPIFVDVLPPMRSWWYAVPWLNLFHISLSVEALCSVDMARTVEQGYLDYHKQESFSDRDRNFARAFSALLHFAHHTLTTKRAETARRYLEKCEETTQSI